MSTVDDYGNEVPCRDEVKNLQAALTTAHTLLQGWLDACSDVNMGGQRWPGAWPMLKETREHLATTRQPKPQAQPMTVTPAEVAEWMRGVMEWVAESHRVFMHNVDALERGNELKLLPEPPEFPFGDPIALAEVANGERNIHLAQLETFKASVPWGAIEVVIHNFDDGGAVPGEHEALHALEAWVDAHAPKPEVKR